MKASDETAPGLMVSGTLHTEKVPSEALMDWTVVFKRVTPANDAFPLEAVTGFVVAVNPPATAPVQVVLEYAVKVMALT